MRSDQSSRTKVYHLIQIRHRDQVEAPLTDWLREAYELQDVLVATRAPVKRAVKKAAKKKVTKKKAAKKKTARTRR